MISTGSAGSLRIFPEHTGEELCPEEVQRLFISVESRFSCASGILPFAVLTVAKVLRITHFCSENRDMSAGAVWKLKLRSGRTNQIICGSFIR